MAPDGGNPENFLQNNQVLDAVDGSIKHILLKISSISQQQAIEELTSDEDETLIQETRNIVYKEALASYSRSYERAKGTSLDVGKVEMKQRKGENKLSRSAKDIVELYLYFVELMPEFPREIIKSNGSYFDIFPADVITVHSSQTAGGSKPNHDQNGLKSVNNDVHEKSCDPQDMGSHSRAELESLLCEALQEKEDMQREMSSPSPECRKDPIRRTSRCTFNCRKKQCRHKVYKERAYPPASHQALPKTTAQLAYAASESSRRSSRAQPASRTQPPRAGTGSRKRRRAIWSHPELNSCRRQPKLSSVHITAASQRF